MCDDFLSPILKRCLSLWVYVCLFWCRFRSVSLYLWRCCFDCAFTRQICTHTHTYTHTYYCITFCINYIKPISHETLSFPVCVWLDVHAVGNKFSLDLENLQVKFNQKTTNANEIYKNFHCHKLVTASICIFHFITFMHSAHTQTHTHNHSQAPFRNVQMLNQMQKR